MSAPSTVSMPPALDAIHRRQSPIKLRDPAPDGSALNAMLAAAMCGPDHGRLKPWRFIVVHEEGRDALGQVLADSLQAREPHSSESVLQKEREKAFRAPVIVIVAARAIERESVPWIEQAIAAGIAAYNILLAASILGYGGMWRTGPAAYDPAVKNALGIDANDALVGFLYLGTPEIPAPARKPIAMDAYVTQWPPINQPTSS